MRWAAARCRVLRRCLCDGPGVRDRVSNLCTYREHGVRDCASASYRAAAQWRHPRGFLGEDASLSAETAETLHDFMLDWFRLDAGPQLATATVTTSTRGLTPATARSSSSSCPAL